MDVIKMSARYRTGVGKSYTRKARSAGWIPAVYYGHNMETKSIEIDAKEFLTILRKKQSGHLIELSMAGEESCITSVVKEIQRHVIKDTFIYHVDFQHVNMDEKVTVKCPVKMIGTPMGVKSDGGILQHSLRELLIEALPMDLVDHIDVDVSELGVGHAIHVRDLSLVNITFKDLPDDVVASVVMPRAVADDDESDTAEDDNEVAEDKGEE